MLKLVVIWLSVSAAVGGTYQTKSYKTDASDIVVTIFKNQVPVCLGTVVAISTSVYLVTAAHCVYGASNSELSIRQDPESNTVEPVQRVLVHPYYSPPSAEYDIALIKMKLPNEKKFSENFKLAAVTLVKVQPTDKVETITWDLKQEESKPTKQTASIEERKSCRAKLNGHILLSSRMLCANIPSTSLPEGTPLLSGDGIVGVGSYYAKGANGNLPKVFTNIANSEIYSFIERYI